jgi:hypothetical protein
MSAPEVLLAGTESPVLIPGAQAYSITVYFHSESKFFRVVDSANTKLNDMPHQKQQHSFITSLINLLPQYFLKFYRLF